LRGVGNQQENYLLVKGERWGESGAYDSQQANGQMLWPMGPLTFGVRRLDAAFLVAA